MARLPSWALIRVGPAVTVRPAPKSSAPGVRGGVYSQSTTGLAGSVTSIAYAAGLALTANPVWNVRMVCQLRAPVAGLPVKSPNTSTTRGEPSTRAVLVRISGSWTRGRNAHSSVPSRGQGVLAEPALLLPVLVHTAWSMPSAAPKYAIVGRAALPAKTLAPITATVERSTPPSAPPSTVRTMVCHCAAPIPETIEAGAISAPIALALPSLSCTAGGWNWTPPASGALVTVNTLRHVPFMLEHPA